MTSGTLFNTLYIQVTFDPLQNVLYTHVTSGPSSIRYVHMQHKVPPKYIIYSLLQIPFWIHNIHRLPRSTHQYIIYIGYLTIPFQFITYSQVTSGLLFNKLYTCITFGPFLNTLDTHVTSDPLLNTLCIHFTAGPLLNTFYKHITSGPLYKLLLTHLTLAPLLNI